MQHFLSYNFVKEASVHIFLNIGINCIHLKAVKNTCIEYVRIVKIFKRFEKPWRISGDMEYIVIREAKWLWNRCSKNINIIYVVPNSKWHQLKQTCFSLVMSLQSFTLKQMAFYLHREAWTLILRVESLTRHCHHMIKIWWTQVNSNHALIIMSSSFLHNDIMSPRLHVSLLNRAVHVVTLLSWHYMQNVLKHEVINYGNGQIT